MTTVCKQCAAVLELEDSVCTQCGTAIVGVPTEPVQSNETLSQSSGIPTFSTGNDLEGIGGWLILVALGLAVSPFILINGIVKDLHVLYGAQFQTGLARLPGLASLILFEAVSNSIFLFGLIALNVLFYRKKKAFPGWMIAYLSINCAVILIDHFVAMHYAPNTQMFSIVRTIIGAGVWIPYYLVSERVKITFVH
jgi:hypothetical protein